MQVNIIYKEIIHLYTTTMQVNYIYIYIYNSLFPFFTSQKPISFYYFIKEGKDTQAGILKQAKESTAIRTRHAGHGQALKLIDLSDRPEQEKGSV